MKTTFRATISAFWVLSLSSAMAAAPESAPAFELDDPQAEILKYYLPKSSGLEFAQAIVIVPSEYRAAQSQPARQSDGVVKRYPVIYLLHGFGGDHTDWYKNSREAKVSLAKLADEFNVILVLPDAMQSSWYLNAPKHVEDSAKWQWESAMADYLVYKVDVTYRTWPEPAGRGVTGLSMGGHGALYLAARHPDRFGACGSMSGAVDLARLEGKYELDKRLGPIDKHRDVWVEHSAITQADKFAGKKTSIMIDCGVDDPFIAENRALHEKLKKLNVEHEYVERPGGHDWKYWMASLPAHLKFLSSRLKPPGLSPVDGPNTFFKYKTIVVDQDLPHDPYGMDLTDMNQDNLLDIVVVLFHGIVWYENPSWKKHVILTNETKMNSYGIARDVDGDGLMDLMISADFDVNDTKKGGSLWFARAPKKAGEKYELTHIADEPTLHRIRWADSDGDGKFELFAQPLKGKDTTAPKFDEKGARLMMFSVPQDPSKEPWPMEVIDDTTHVTHALRPVQWDDEIGAELLATSFEGVHLYKRLRNGTWKKYHLCEGEQKTSPSRGAGEVVLGKMAHGQKRYIATIEPWHGHEVVVYHEPNDWKDMWKRGVIDDTFDQGHAIGAGDLDGDGYDEVIAGYRGANKGGYPSSLKAYKMLDYDHNTWQKQWIDVGDMAAEDLRINDINQDGKRDVIAVGRSTRNVKLYLNTGDFGG